MGLTNLLLTATFMLFFYSRPYVDLLPFPIPHHALPPLPATLPPLFLLAGFIVWLWFRTDGKRLLFVAGITAFLPVLLSLSVPLLPDILYDVKWFLTTSALFLAAPVFLCLTLPAMKRFSKFRKLLFVITGWLVNFSFMFFLFLLLIRGNALPLSAAFACFTSFLALAWLLSDGSFSRSMKILTIVGSVPLLMVVVSLFVDGHTVTPEENSLHKTALFTAGPYLQNMQKTSVTVMWETTKPLPGKVLVSQGKEILSQAITGSGNPSDTGAFRSFESPVAAIHEVPINGLSENTVYFYRVLSNGIASEIGTFQTAYEDNLPFEFVVYGDSQEMFGWVEYLVSNRHKKMCDSILTYSTQAQFAVHVGDMTFLGNEHERWQREFFGRAGELMRDKVIWPVIGNHELNASWYFDYFSVPNSDEHYYYFDYGNSRFIILAVEGYASGHTYGPPEHTPLEPGSPQYEWLENTLEDSQDKAWRFVFFHQSPWSSGIEGGYTPARTCLTPLFKRYHVNAVFSGHDHTYELSVEDNILYIITGGGGGVLGTLRPDIHKNPYSRYFKAVWHHCNVQVTPERFELKAIDLKGRVFHRVRVNASGEIHISRS